MFLPGYVILYKEGKLQERIEQAFEMLRSCCLCPRGCGVNRKIDEMGLCRSGKELQVYSTLIHRGEEPPISGNYGSGVIFFSNCNLKCIYCQNFLFSQLGKGNKCSSETLAGFMLDLKHRGAHNINLVSPTHFLPQILESLKLAVEKGLDIPLVYNTSGYESMAALKLLEGVVDIYLADLRYSDDEVAWEYSGVHDYWPVSKTALKEMYRQAGNLKIKAGIAYQGLIVRHLILPEGLSGTRKAMEFLSREISPSIHISLMRQYYPAFKAKNFPPLDRPITNFEYEQARRVLEETGLINGWFQKEFNPEDTEQFAGEFL